MKKDRNLSIDIIRAFCMLCIILAHVSPPEYLFQLRNFDVVGLVIISAMVMKPTFGMKDYCLQIKKRLIRLAVPTYIAITVILVGTLLFSRMFHIEYPYDIVAIVSSYLLLDGIGYVWIVRILLIITLFSPILYKISKWKLSWQLTVGVLVCILSKILYMNMPDNKLLHFLLYYYVLYPIGYLVIATYGITFKNMQKTTLIKVILFQCLALVIYKAIMYTAFEEPLFTLEKHPPMLDWILYGMIITNILYYIANILVSKLKNTRIEKSILWMSKQSFNVYFMHIFVLKGAELVYEITNFAIHDWFLKYILVLVTSIGFTLTFNLTKNKVKQLNSKFVRTK